MNNAAFNFDSMSVSERIQLVEDLWDSIAASAADVPLSDTQRDEIDRRLESLGRDPLGGSSWPEVRLRVEERLRDCS